MVPYRHPTFAPLAPHPSVSPLPSFPQNHYQEPHRRLVHSGDDFYYLSPQLLNSTGFDRPNLPFPRVSDRTIHSLPHGKSVLPDVWKRGRGGGVTLEKPGVFEETPGRSQPYEISFKSGDPDLGPMGVRRLQSDQDRFLGEVSDWRYPRQLRFLDARESRCHDPCFEQLSQEAASLATEPPPFYCPGGLHRSGSVNNRCGNYSHEFVHCPPRSPLSSGRYFSDLEVVSSTEAMLADSQVIGNGLEPQWGLSIYRKTNCVDVPPDHGFEGSQYVEYKPIKKSDPSNVANEIGFSSIYHMVRKTHNTPRMEYAHKLAEGCSIGNKGKRKMSNNRNGKFHARSGKRPMQKPSAFSRIQSGLSVWDRLEEKPLILCSPSPSCPLSSPPRISNDTEGKVDILDLPIKSNAVLAKAVNPLNIKPSSIKEDLFVEKSVEIPNIVMKKKKKMSKVWREVKTPIVSVSAGSSAKQGVGKISNVSSSGSVSVQAEANKAEVSKDAAKMLCNKKVKKLTVGKVHETTKAAKIFYQVEGCKFGCSEKYVKETNDCIPNDDAKGKLVNDSHLQLSQNGKLVRMIPTRDASGKNITKTANQVGDHVTETLDNSGGESSELEKTFDNRFISLLVSDALVPVNTNSQPFNKQPLNNAATQDLSLNMDKDDAANSSEQVKLEVMGSVNSIDLKIEQEMPTADSATPPDMLCTGEVFISTGSKTLSYIDNSVNCNNTDIEIERQVKMQEKIELFTASKEPEVPGQYFSSQSCLHGLQDLSFSKISSAAANQKLPSERTVKEDNEFNLLRFNLIPQSDYNVISGDNLGTLRIDSNGAKLEQDFFSGSMKMDSSDLIFGDTLLSRQCSESMEFINNTSSGTEEKKHRGKSETFVRTKASVTSESVHESGKIIKNQKIISQKSQASPSDVLTKKLPPNAKNGEEFCCKQTLPQYAVSKFLSRTTKNLGQLKDIAHTCQAGRHRKWIRTNTHLHSDENQKRGRISSNQTPKKLVKIHNSSYIRKGNSLIRKLAAKPPPALLPAVGAASRKFESIPESSSLRESRGEFLDFTKLSHPLFERPKTPPLPPPSKLSDCTMYPCKDFPLLRQVVTSHEPVTNEGKQHDQSKGLAFGNLWSLDSASCKGVEILNPTRVTYAKQKKNQLAADPCSKTDDSSNFLIETFQIPVHHPTGTPKILPLSSSYLYYRSKRNQLIRSAYFSGSQLTGIPACEANIIDLIQRRSALHLKRLDVHQKAKKPRISSLVWTLAGDKLSKRSIRTLGCQMVFPYLFPWKRVANQKSFIMNDRFPISSRFPLSLISQKLQCLRKRDTIYKVSTDGFTLRKAGVVSIGGSNLKWSKSIEKRSKKASEEATLAVAEVERNKRERKKSKSTRVNGKNKHGLTCRSARGTVKQGDARERIFRVGSARYKMDASKRTLIRIADDHSSSPTSQQPGTSSLKSFIPRRLIIGNDEYVRIGNGNQLVRDPKKLQRILASEKVRWSLHTARLKLAQKRQYCLFFTRFGTCNKSGGKCPYIHDSSKVSICPKFLRGQCSDINCKLTHEVIQERMPDCSYFLKGLCTNLNCPYRHVKVNANAPLCDGFLRGNCADGDECRKKHSYTCPIFEATGSCPQGSLCKLGHPKSQSKSRKRKRTKLKSSNQGRYFFSSIGKAIKPLSIASSQNDLEDPNDIFCSDGLFTEYINLDTDSDDVGIGNNVLMDSYPGKLACGMKSCDIDALIKPVQIMKRDDLAIF